MNNPKNFSPVNAVIGNTSKEREKSVFSPEIKEAVEQESPKELASLVEATPEKVKAAPELKKFGVEEKLETPKYPDRQKISLPLSDEMVVKGLHAPVTSSLRWLAEWAEYLLKKAHLTLKQIHGHVVRILRK